MVLIPGCKCLPCAFASRASAVEVTLQGDDLLQLWSVQAVRTDSGLPVKYFQYGTGHTFSMSDGFRGSDYNGTFSLTKTSDTGRVSTWTYTWTDSGPTCGASIVVVLSDGCTPSAQVISVALTVTGKRYSDPSSTATKGLSDFDCGASDVTFTGGGQLTVGSNISGVQNGLIFGYGTAARTCANISSPIAFDVRTSRLIYPVISSNDVVKFARQTLTSETLPSSSTLYSPVGGSQSRDPIVKFTGLTVYR